MILADNKIIAIREYAEGLGKRAGSKANAIINAPANQRVIGVQ